MRRTLVCACAAFVFWTFTAHAQTPSYAVPGQGPDAAPVKKPRPKKRKPKKAKAPPAPPPSPPEPLPPLPELEPAPSAPVPPEEPPAPEPPPPPPPRAAEPEAPRKWLDATTAPPADGKPMPTFSLRLDPSWGYRRFVQTEDSSTGKRFGTPGSFLIGGRAELYPLASTEAGPMRDIGITAAYVRAIGVSLTDFDSGKPVDATWYSFSAGLRARVLGRTGPFALAFSAGLEEMVFSFDADIAPIREVPTGRYSLLFGGFDARHSFGNFSLFLEAAYLYPFHIDDLGDRIANVRAYGGRGVFGGAFKFTRTIEIDAHATYTFVRFSLQPVAGRADAPGRVFDQYIVSTLAFRLNL